MTSDQLFRILILVTLAANVSISIYFRRQADQQGGQLDPSGNRVLLFLRLALFSTIGKKISPTHATRENHQLFTNGPYQYVRHPVYTVGFTIFFGIGLMATMWWLLVGLLILSVVIVWRTGSEEENLLQEFGDEYRTYMNRTGRYLPKLVR